MKYHNKRADDLISEMENIVSRDEFMEDDDDRERLDELYGEVKRDLDRDFDDSSIEHKSLQKRFREVSREFETPDDIREAEMESMFPDDDDMEGFDWTLEDGEI